jgi:hypothetical protein
MTREQYGVVRRAMDRVRDGEGDPGMSEGRALELLCADWMA